jgi:hypothetical protein
LGLPTALNNIVLD